MSTITTDTYEHLSWADMADADIDIAHVDRHREYSTGRWEGAFRSIRANAMIVFGPSPDEDGVFPIPGGQHFGWAVAEYERDDDDESPWLPAGEWTYYEPAQVDMVLNRVARWMQP